MAKSDSATLDNASIGKFSQSNFSLGIFQTELTSLLEDAAVCIEKYLEAHENKETEEVAYKIEPLLKKVICSMYSKVGEIKNECLLSETFQYLVSVSEIARIMKSFCDFIRITFRRLGTTGLNTNLISSLLTIESFFWDCCSENSGLREILSYNGIIIHFLYQLGELRKNSTRINIVEELMSISIGVLNNFASFEEYHKQFIDTTYYLVFVPYIKSPLVHLRFTALFTFSYFSRILPGDHIAYLALESHEAKAIIESLCLSQYSDEVHLVGCIFSVVEILIILKNLAALPSNSILLVQNGIFQVINTTIGSCYTQVKTLSLTLLWMICMQHEEATSKLLARFVPQSLNEKELVTVILSEVQLGPSKIDINKTVQAMTACYNYQRYQKCYELFETVKENLHTVIPSLYSKIKLLVGKSLYHLFVKQQRALTKYTTNVKTYKLEHEKCFSKIKQAIVMLGEVLDNGYLDEEGSKLLDFSMIEYVKGTNNLKACRRCVLCRQKASLKRSHLWPESLLRLFQAGVDTPLDKKIFYTISSEGILHSYSAHQKAYYMFCFNCEHLLCVNGENQCIPIFKNVIYNAHLPSSSSMQLSIHYEKYFYYFCVGLIFRGLVSSDPCVSITAFTNEDEIYRLVVSCRNAILDLPKMKELPSKFKIAVLFSPIQIKSSEKHTGFINTMLTSFGDFAFSDCCLSDGSICEPREAQFFLAHCGVFNVVVPLGRSHEISLLPEYIITPNTGTYLVPPGEKRMELLPPGLVNFFRLIADKIEVSFFESPKKLVERNYIKPDPNVEEVIGHNAALDEDIEQTGSIIRLPSFIQNPKTLSYLPAVFKIEQPNNRPSLIHIPSGHKILLHHTFLQQPKGKSLTIFVAVGSDKGYSLNKPYVIYHTFNDKGIKISGGFFFSPTTLEKTDHLPDNLLKLFASQVSQVHVTQLKTKLQEMFRLKGFKNIFSLLLHSERTSESVVLDTKCYPRRCWYCKDLCEICMKPCSVGCEATDSSTIVMYRFCSTCWQESECKEAVWPLCSVLQNDNTELKNNYFPKHKTLLSVKWSPDVFELYTLSLCVCVSNGSTEHPYILCQTRNLFKQSFTEYYISQDFSYIQVMSLINTKVSEPYFKCNDSFVQMVLSDVFSTSGFQNIIETFNSFFYVQAPS